MKGEISDSLVNLLSLTFQSFDVNYILMTFDWKESDNGGEEAQFNLLQVNTLRVVPTTKRSRKFLYFY